MQIDIVKVPSGKFCSHPCCKKDPKFVTPKGRIKKGKTAAQLTFVLPNSRYRKTVYFYYCRACIDQLLLDCRAKLDHKLWIFS